MGTCQVAGHSAAAAGASDAAHAQGAQPLRERPDGSNAKHASAEDEGAAQLSLLQRAEQAQRHEQQRLPRLEPGPRHADASGAEGTAGTDGGALSLVVGNGDGVGSACGGRGDERSAIDGGADRSEERERRDTQEEEAEVALMLMRSAQGAFALAAREGEASSEAGRQRSGCAIGSRRQGGAHSSSSADPRAAMVARLMLNDASTNGAPPLAQASADLAAAREHRDPSLGPQATVAGAALVAADAAAVAGAPPHSRERAAVWPVGASAASPAGAEPASAVPASAAPAAAFGAPAAAGAATPAEPQPGLGRTLKPGGQRKQACAKCHSAKAACEGYPCRRCARLGMQCFFPVRCAPEPRLAAATVTRTCDHLPWALRAMPLSTVERPHVAHLVLAPWTLAMRLCTARAGATEQARATDRRGARGAARLRSAGGCLEARCAAELDRRDPAGRAAGVAGGAARAVA